MRSTGNYSTWLTASWLPNSMEGRSSAEAAVAPIRLTYLGEHVRRGGCAYPGAVLAQRYELEAPLVARTPSTLWQAWRLRPERNQEEGRDGPVTVQLLDPALVDDPGLLGAFLQEARTAAAIDHPHLARVLDFGVDPELDSGVPFLVLEPLVGETLADRLMAKPRLAGPELAGIIGEAARGLEALHRCGLVHRRLDPEHLFLRSGPAPAPRTQLLFAIDEVLGDNLSLMRKLSHHLSGQVAPHVAPHVASAPGGPAQARLDTAEYQSPEQLLGHDPIDERSDLWSLAVIAFEAATGTPAFSGSSLGDRLVQICNGEPNLAPADLSLPTGFASWFQKAVRKHPAERFASARQMADALHSLLPPD